MTKVEELLAFGDTNASCALRHKYFGESSWGFCRPSIRWLHLLVIAVQLSCRHSYMPVAVMCLGALTLAARRISMRMSIDCESADFDAWFRL